MQPKIIKERAILLAGLSFYGDPFDTSNAWTEENQIGLLWQRLIRYFENHEDALEVNLHQCANYEVHIHGPETKSAGLSEVFVGVKIPNIDRVPHDLLVKVLPIAQYAVFTLKGKAIVGDWGREIDAWMDENGFREAYGYTFQYYDERFKGLDKVDESALDIYVPIKAVK